jgi:PAS domain S-box-containing protein
MTETPVDRSLRLAVLRRYGGLDVASDPDFQSLAELAAALCDAPVAAVTMMRRDGLGVVAIVGSEADPTVPDDALCRMVIQDAGPILHISDLTADPRTAKNPLMIGHDGARLYAGAALRTPEGVAIGAICVVDVRPRVLSPTQLRGLQALAGQAMAVLELKRAQLRLVGAVEDPHEAVFILDADLRFVCANAAAEQIFGAGRADLLGQRPWEVTGQAPATVRALRRVLEGAAAAGGRAGATTRAGPDGRRLEIDVDVADGLITVHARAMGAWRADSLRSALLEAAIQQTGDMVLVGEIDGDADAPQPGIVFANRAFEVQTGFRPEDYIGRPPSMLRGPESDPVESRRLREALLAGKTVQSEVLCYGKSGEPMWLELNGAPVRDVDGVLTNWVAVYRNVTARKEEQARLKAVLELAADAIYEYDVIGGRMIFSEGIRSVFGHDWVGEYAIPSPWAEHVHPDDLSPVRRSMLEALAGDAEQWRGHYRMRRGDGSWAEVSERCRILRDAQGRPVRAIGAILDVTRERALEQQLRQVQRMEAVGRLTGGVAHDFNNLLTVILGNAEMLEDRLGDDEAMGPMARIVREAAERGARLVAQLLAFSRRQPLAPRATDVATVMGDMREMLESSLGREVSLDVSVAPDSPPAMVDPGQLESALLNLALNARDAMPDGGRLTIAARRVEITAAPDGGSPGDDGPDEERPEPGNYLAITVRDEGVGMDPAVRARAFEPFFTTKEPGKGSGLGLSMVHGFALQSGGGVRITSAPGEGAAVTILLPVADAHVTDAPAAQRLAAAGGETVLMVEDDPLVRDHVAAQLRSLGYRVVVARDGREALTLLTERPDVELLFTDIVMPGGMNGRSLAELARVLRPKLPILFTTGYEDETLGASAAADGPGAAPVLRKPYRRHVLAQALRDALEQGARGR